MIRIGSFNKFWIIFTWSRVFYDNFWNLRSWLWLFGEHWAPFVRNIFTYFGRNGGIFLRIRARSWAAIEILKGKDVSVGARDKSISISFFGVRFLKFGIDWKYWLLLIITRTRLFFFMLKKSVCWTTERFHVLIFVDNCFEFGRNWTNANFLSSVLDEPSVYFTLYPLSLLSIIWWIR